VKKPEINLIGAGNLAYHLGISLHRAGYHINQIFSRTQQHAERLAKIVGAEAISDFEQLNNKADMYIFALTDHVLSNLPALKLRGKIVAHTSGILPSNELIRISNDCGIFYPLQTFKKGKTTDFSEVFITVFANTKRADQMLRYVADSLSKHVVELNDTQREWLHLSAVFANNFTNILLDVSYELACSNNIPFEMLKPLIRQTYERAISGEAPGKFQTGPAVRGDINTINHHADMLMKNPKFQQLYRSLSALIKERVSKQ